jgi:hypothetical protein
MPVLVTEPDPQVGDVIRFASLSSHDTNTYYGKVVSRCSYEVAKFYNDITGYNTQIQSEISGIGDYDTHTYIIVELMEPITDNTITMVSFAIPWIDPAAYFVVSTQKRLYITVFDADETNLTEIIGILAAANWKAAQT